MKTFPAAFNTEKNKAIGSKPLWILRITIASVDYWIGAKAVTIPAFTACAPWPVSTVVNTVAWVKQWGEIREGVSGALGEFHVSEFSVSFLIDKSIGTNIEALVTGGGLSDAPVELYQWFVGCTAAPQRIFLGFVRDCTGLTDTTVDIAFQDESIKLEKNQIGTVLDSSAYPLADPDHIGRMIPIPFGSVSKLPALCVDSGWVSSCVNEIGASNTALLVSELPAYSLAGKSITIDDEQMSVSAVSSSQPAENMASTSLGATIAATTELTSNPATMAADGNRVHTTLAPSLWMSSASPSFPQVLTVTFPADRDISQIDIFFPQDNLTNPGTPVLNVTTGTLYCQPDFTLWVRDPGDTYWIQVGTAIGNNLVWRRWTFLTKRTRKIKAEFTSVRQNGTYVNCSELEAWGTDPAATGDKWLTVSRGGNSTVAVTHAKGSTVIEKKATPLVYLCSDRPLTSIGNIFARIRGVLVDITSDCTKYPNVAVGDLGGLYVGKGAITIPDFAKVSQRISIELNNTLDVTQGSHTHPTGTSTTTFAFDQISNVTGSWSDSTHTMAAAIDGNTGTYARPDNIGGVATLKRVASVTGGGTPVSARIAFNFAGSYVGTTYKVYMGGVLVVQGTLPAQAQAVVYSGSFPVTAWSQFYTGGGFFVQVSMAGSQYLYECYVEVTMGTAIAYSAAAGVGLVGDLGLSGNSVADIMIGDAILVDCSRSVTTPAAVVGDLLSTYCGISAAVVQSGTFPVSYAINGALTERDTALKTINRIAFQCRAWFALLNGSPRLVVRGTGSSVKTLSACNIDGSGRRQLVRRMTDSADVIKKVIALYDRDWSQSRSATSFKGTVTATGSTGSDERPELFWFDMITSSAMAADVAQFYLDFYKVRHWLAEFTETLADSELEFGDLVTLAFLGSVQGSVTVASHAPGSADVADSIKLTVMY